MISENSVYFKLMSQIDHLVIAAESLQQGVDFVRTTFDVDIPAGGYHQTMGTHNHLMQLGNEAYIEVIAINPDATPPKRPRWFSLDDALMRDSLRQQPRLITWVINTPDIETLAQKSLVPIGNVTELSRDNLSWSLGLTGDGRLLGYGMLPYVIQWHTRQHPSGAMADLGCRFESLEIYHNRPQWLGSVLASMGADQLVRIQPLPDTEAPYLSVRIKTASSTVTLTSKSDRPK